MKRIKCDVLLNTSPEVLHLNCCRQRLIQPINDSINPSIVFLMTINFFYRVSYVYAGSSLKSVRS